MTSSSPESSGMTSSSSSSSGLTLSCQIIRARTKSSVPLSFCQDEPGLESEATSEPNDRTFPLDETAREGTTSDSMSSSLVSC